MTEQSDLNRFIEAQKLSYATALSEIRAGKKRSHWMWYIFPQIVGLGFSEMSRFYGIINKAEASAYLQHPVLGNRLLEISKELLRLKSNNAGEIFGSPDDLKLKSSMTLFSSLDNTDPVFNAILIKFFNGSKDEKTLIILKD